MAKLTPKQPCETVLLPVSSTPDLFACGYYHPSLLVVSRSRKYPYQPRGGSLEIPRGRGDSKTIFFKRMYETKLEFPEGWGVETKKKNPPWKGYGYFLQQHNGGILLHKNNRMEKITVLVVEEEKIWLFLVFCCLEMPTRTAF